MTPQALATLHAACFTTPRPWRADEFAGFLDDPTCALTSLPGGFALTRTVVGETELLTIAVAPDQRRTGLGGLLLDQAVLQAQKASATRMFLEVAAGNIAAIALYTNAGFTPIGQRRNYYRCPDGSTQTAIILTRDLQEKHEIG